jgi:hypothetical protein
MYTAPGLNRVAGVSDDSEPAAASAGTVTAAWEPRHTDLLQLDALDLGYRVVIAEFGPHSPAAYPPEFWASERL